MDAASEHEVHAFYDAIAPYYDQDYQSAFEHSVPFYRRVAEQSGGPVLETGCGTGRVLLPLAVAGFTVRGVDSSLAMLGRLADTLRTQPLEVQRRVTVTQGDIRSMDLKARFPLVIAAGNVPHTFVEREDQRAWLRTVRRHLMPRGALCFDVFQPDYRLMCSWSDNWVRNTEYLDHTTGRKIRRLYRCTPEFEWQRFRLEFRWVEEDLAGHIVARREATIMQRWFTRGELENLLELEGFRVTDFWGSFDFEPFGIGVKQQNIRAVLAS